MKTNFLKNRLRKPIKFKKKDRYRNKMPGRFGKGKYGKDRLGDGRPGKGYNMMPENCPPQQVAGRKKFKLPKFEYRFGSQKAKMRQGVRFKFKTGPGAEDETLRLPGPGRFKDRKCNHFLRIHRK
ncbi:hypothetical protein CEXT_593421 [Caerostris extrusa]|uniref:Uncharacterized protein n=1 Tax=Caerostris extrusa TaxID=172846 RepID=A0AAV4NVJ8_CAEEX|nr:hypothetical protein CEXT_593421 [Caerostris extrusa]